jgi:predicted peptidase
LLVTPTDRIVAYLSAVPIRVVNGGGIWWHFGQSKMKPLRLISSACIVLATGFICLPRAAIALSYLDSPNYTIGAGTRGGNPMPYRLYFPRDYTPDQDFPLVVFLHGAGERGADNTQHVSPSWFNLLLQHTYVDYPAVLVAPQVYAGEAWGSSYPHDHVAELLAKLTDEYAIDERRIYVTGLSMGGFGAMTFLQEFHYDGLSDIRFAAVAPSAGAWYIDDPAVREAIRHTPIWLSHNDGDPTVDVEASRDTFRFLTGLAPSDPIPFEAGPPGLAAPTAVIDNIRYTEFSANVHDSWSAMWRSNIFYDWMFAQSLPVPEPATTAIAACGCWALAIRRRRWRN